MSSETEAPSQQPEALQFDHAEFEKTDAPTVACSACQKPIEDHYFDLNGAVICETCRDGIEAHLQGGSGLSRAVRATLMGGGAALLAALGYSLFIHLTGLDWSLISVLVGLFIGTLVRKGSGGRGGSFYQALAVFLTYTSVGLTYTAVGIVGAGLPAAIWLEPAFLAKMAEVLFQIPVLHAKESPISILIIGFALWEAWKLNKPLKLVLSGPYRVGDAQARPAEVGADA